MIMKTKQLIILSGLILIFVIFAASYNVRKQSETIIIPNKEENQIEVQKSGSFKVKKIYRLPKADQLLGWTASNTVVGFFQQGNDTTERLASQPIQRLTFPFEKPETLQSIERNTANIKVSPDGKNAVGLTISTDRITLNLMSLTHRNKKKIDSFPLIKGAYVKDISWSNNSKDICYLVIDPEENRKTGINVYNTDSGALKTFSLKDFDEKESLSAASISDDGRNVLLTMSHGQQTRIVRGTITNDEIMMKNKRQNSYDEPVWLNNYQFLFLGAGGTLYEYDLRNSELSVLLGNVDVFKISNDRKKIAYSLYGKDNTYAGILQGKNILNPEPIYHGTSPSEMYWSPDGKNLLINDKDLYFSSESSSYIIAFK
ncbi:WD40 repeat domain-containing protein [Bacillus stercoris]|uniref:WD40 repeat domain-containing protein n=1 Tax=Bacillus stercoris TaxID=2054641 RepID=UPI002ACAB393|nr:WD40 repeat domain-containing protein [Bacillus stercoris]MDZ5670448.1 WD40 repeat domain-containing protein [Bacillus stercoris]